jgi:formylglycine-generating enzyme required for sulfatase activity
MAPLGSATPGKGVANADKTGSPATFTEPLAGIEFVLVKGGCYQMGDNVGARESDEKPVHEVCVDDFYMGKYEVTQGQWKAILEYNPSEFYICGDNCPVESVSWKDVQIFIRKLNEESGANYRLPTEAEWEYAARSGGKNEKWAGTSSESDLGQYAWYVENSGNTTHPVGQKLPNVLGLYDMSGNVSEWAHDYYSEKYYKKSPRHNPQGPDSGPLRVERGGAWRDNARFWPVTARSSQYPDYSRFSLLGLRLARSRTGK